MKILELRFKNLNSLYGEWLIDFTDPEYVSNGDLCSDWSDRCGQVDNSDAICLALWSYATSWKNHQERE